MKVMKFGGTSVGDAAAIQKTCKIIQYYANRSETVVVVSAMSGVTNTLLSLSDSAIRGDSEAVETARAVLLGPHRKALQSLLPSGQRRRSVSAELGLLVDEASRLLYSIYILRELSARARDRLVSFGERMSSVIVAATLAEMGTPAQPVFGEALIVTDSVFGSAAPLLVETKTKTVSTLQPLFESHTLPVVTGYFGANESGITTTLGRGGSDFSASILGNALQADEILIWTDVSGVLTADPRLVPAARSVNHLTYTEATELAYFGAEVIHPKTMYPAAEAGVPIHIRNTFHPEDRGTTISDCADDRPGPVAKAIASISGLSAITVAGRGLISVSDVTARIFNVVAGTEANVYMISQASSQHSVSFVIQTEALETVYSALAEEFAEDIRHQRVLSIGIDRDLAIVAVVGDGMRGTPGVAGKVFGTMGTKNINIIAIAQGSSELNISFAIAESEVGDAVSALHDRFVPAD